MLSNFYLKVYEFVFFLQFSYKLTVSSIWKTHIAFENRIAGDGDPYRIPEGVKSGFDRAADYVRTLTSYIHGLDTKALPVHLVATEENPTYSCGWNLTKE